MRVGSTWPCAALSISYGARRLAEAALQDLRAGSELIEIIGPAFHHGQPFFPMFTARIGSAHFIALGMAKLALDCIGIPMALRVQQRAGHRAEAVGGHRLAIKPHAAQGEVDRVFAHRTIPLALGREEVAAVAAYLAQFVQDGEHLPGQRNAVRDPHLGFLGGDGPDVLGQIKFGPFGVPELARTHEDMRGEAEGPHG